MVQMLASTPLQGLQVLTLALVARQSHAPITYQVSFASAPIGRSGNHGPAVAPLVRLGADPCQDEIRRQIRRGAAWPLANILDRDATRRLSEDCKRHRGRLTAY